VDIVPEKSTAVLTVSFKDENGNPVTPSSGSYRIDDVASGEEVTADTPFTPVGSSHDIEITPAENAMQGTGLSEDRRVTLSFTYSGTKQGKAEYIYRLKNLSKVS
jgi:hypothetical protein